MYGVSVKDYIFITHSLDHPSFGPAQKSHGATLNLKVTVFSEFLNDMNIVLDIGVLKEIVTNLKSEYHYKNLDKMEEFDGVLTTIEFLCTYFFNKIRKELQKHDKMIGQQGVSRIRVEIEESPQASAFYEEDIE